MINMTNYNRSYQNSIRGVRGNLSNSKAFQIVKTILQKEKESIDLLDAYIESVFVEMFGDPILNPNSWEVKPLSEYCKDISKGKQNPTSFSGDIPWITSKDIINRGITNTSKENLTLSESDVFDENRVIVPMNSVLMVNSGNVGTCSIVGTPLVISQFLFAFQCNENIDSMYLMHYLSCRQDYIKKITKGSNTPYIDIISCRNIPVMCPPMVLQKTFIQKAYKTFALKHKMLEQYDQYSELITVLQHKI